MKTNHGGVCVFIRSDLHVKVVDFPYYKSFVSFQTILVLVLVLVTKISLSPMSRRGLLFELRPTVIMLSPGPV